MSAREVRHGTPGGQEPRAESGRYVIGIDLGTTNCALAWADLHETTISGIPRVQRFDIPQLIAESEVASQPTLPSFLYLPTADERVDTQLGLPWNAHPDRVAGAWARDNGALLPGRLVYSAKSWLCHDGVDRHAKILPVDADPAERVCSPVEASTAYIAHLRDAWNHAMAAGAGDRRLERQDVVLTVPASFDEEARELTVEAARAAGLEHFRLQEEPTAALYAWIGNHRQAIGRHLRAGDTVLVCDVGGGTTDFTLVHVRSADDELLFERVAVGSHLLLGGDNLDLAIARLLESRLQGPPLSLRQRQALRRQSSAAKELLLTSDVQVATIKILGAGRAVVGGAQVVDLSRSDVEQLLFEGFLPAADIGDRPVREGRMGLRELGLPYEVDPAITRHLAAFLGEVGAATAARPDAVLLNGGFFAPAAARDRLVGIIGNWLAASGNGQPLRVLTHESPATAVAEGAVGYGLVHHGFGARIGGGSARAYYIGVQRSDRPGSEPASGELPPPAESNERAGANPSGAVTALCVLPRGTEEGTRLAVSGHDLEVTANRPLAFSLWSSRTRRDAFAELVHLDPVSAHAHAPLVAELRYGKRSRQTVLPVHVEVELTELGTLELWLASRETDHRWRLQFALRGARPGAADSTSAEAQVHVGADALAAAAAAIGRTFGAGEAAVLTPDQLPAILETTLALGRHAWPVAAIRPLADALLERADGRRLSSRHEARWLNLFGFCARPGFGATLDEFRMTQARRVYMAGLAFAADVQCQAEWMVLWQRVAGGLTAGQQQDLYHRHAPPLIASLTRRGKRLPPQVERETWRMLASLERLPVTTRANLAGQLVGCLLEQPDQPSLWWAFGRVAARTPTYGPLNTVTPAAKADDWVRRLLTIPELSHDAFAALVDAAGFTGDAARDLDADVQKAVDRRLRDSNAEGVLLARLREPGLASRAELQRRYGETIPEGLALVTASAIDYA